MQDAEWSNSELCQQKYGSNKSVYCYGGNYFTKNVHLLDYT